MKHPFLITGLVILISFLYYVLKPRKRDENSFKMWEFNEDSWHARYYKWFTSSKTLPQGGCVYFWAMTALLIFSPLIFGGYAILQAINWLANLIPDKPQKTLTTKEWERNYEREERMQEKICKIMVILGKISLILVVLGIIIFCIFVLGTNKNNWFAMLIFIGIIALAVLFFLGTGWVIHYLTEKVPHEKYRLIGTPFRYIGSIIVAIYTKSCPHITWHKKEQLSQLKQ